MGYVQRRLARGAIRMLEDTMVFAHKDEAMLVVAGVVPPKNPEPWWPRPIADAASARELLYRFCQLNGLDNFTMSTMTKDELFQGLYGMTRAETLDYVKQARDTRYAGREPQRAYRW